MRWCMAAGMSGSRPADVLAGRSGGGSSTGQLRARPSAARSYVHAYDLVIGLELGDVPMDGCITKAPCGGQRAGPSPVDRRKGGRKRSVASGGYGIPLGIVSAPGNGTTPRRWPRPCGPRNASWTGPCRKTGSAAWTADTTAPSPGSYSISWASRARSPVRACLPPSRQAPAGSSSARMRG
jgi:hypothetical protein